MKRDFCKIITKFGDEVLEPPHLIHRPIPEEVPSIYLPTKSLKVRSSEPHASLVSQWRIIGDAWNRTLVVAAKMVTHASLVYAVPPSWLLYLKSVKLRFSLDVGQCDDGNS